MSIPDKLSQYNPNGVANTNNTIFGLPFDVAESRLVFLPLPWDASVSGHHGTAAGPANILRHSFQIDLYDPLVPNAWKQGMAMEAIDPAIGEENRQLKKKAQRVIHFLEGGGVIEQNEEMQGYLDQINAASEKFILDVEMKCLQYMENGQIPFLVGGDHSISTGYVRALAKQGKPFGILQIDAHADMRDAYQGFTHSHASVMRHALGCEGVEQIVQAGIRELCSEEVRVISHNHKKVKTFFDHDLHQRLFEGETWSDICHDIIEKLPDDIYVTFDVDGLEPSCCPGTGTPVPGGLSYNQALHILETAFNAGKRIIGADLAETGPERIDGIVSARILYRIAGMMIKSNE